MEHPLSDFTQTLLVPPAAVEVRIRLGFVAERGHAQIMVEAFEPSSRVLLAQWSRPTIHMADFPQAFEEAIQRANEHVQEFVNPF
jgi:hypothetical protein